MFYWFSKPSFLLSTMTDLVIYVKFHDNLSTFKNCPTYQEDNKIQLQAKVKFWLRQDMFGHLCEGSSHFVTICKF